MQKNKILFLSFFLLLLTFACKPDTHEDVAKPENLLDRAKMIEMLTEIQLADAAANRAGMSVDSRKKQKDIYFNAILEKYATQPQVFYNSYNYYIAQKIDTTIYNEVIKNLEQTVKTESAKQPKVPAKPNVPANVAPEIRR